MGENTSTKTSFTAMRLAVANLRRKPYGLFSRAFSTKNRPVPVPFLADDGRPLDQLDHGQVNNSIYRRDPATSEEEILCQVCGLAITPEDTTFFLLVDNDPFWRPSDDWDELLEYQPRFTEVDDPAIPKMRSNSGPVHLYCARVSLRLCPAIKTEHDDPNKIIGWTSPMSAVEAMNDDPYTWVDDRNRIYAILAQVPRERHVTLHQLDEMVTGLKETALTNPMP